MTSPICRSCGTPLTRTLIDLGKMPLANAFLTGENKKHSEPKYELHARVCDRCFLVQVNHLIPPADIFTDYAYFSSYSKTWLDHSKAFCILAIDRLQLTNNSLVLEIASNDGYLLSYFAEQNIPVLGVDPAIGPANVARGQNIPTETIFFGSETSKKLRNTYGEADLIIANNVLAHVPDINDFLSGFGTCLRKNGVATFEFPNVMNLIKDTQFDTIYHEHYSYLSLHSVEICLSRHGLRIFDVEELDTHGGSLRIWACHCSDLRPDAPGLTLVRQKERDFGISTYKTYHGLTKQAETVRQNLTKFLYATRNEKKTVAGYGAAAKGNTLLNYCKLTTREVEFVVDANPHKQGTWLPGSHIPVEPIAALEKNRPDYIIILPWNIATEIISACSFVRGWGGQFVTAIPQLKVLP